LKEIATKLAVLVLSPLSLFAQFHRAEQDREIRYWLLDPESHQFRISHDFTVSKPGERYVYSYVRKGSSVMPDSRITQLDTGKALKTTVVKEKDVTAVRGELEKPLADGESARVRVEETYTDTEGYTVKDGELTWTRTLGRPFNRVTLPEGWMLVSVNTPAIVSLDEQKRVMLRFTNTRNDELAVTIHARRRPAK